MRIFSILILLGLAYSGIAQEYSAWSLNATVMTSLTGERGAHMMHGLQAGRHLGLGLYALAEHNTTNTNRYEEGNFIGTNHFDVWGLGLEKKLFVTKSSQISFSALFNYYSTHQVNYVDRVYDGAFLNRDQSLEQYASGSDIGFSLTMDYQMQSANGLAIGPSVRYDSRMESVLFGLRAGLLLDQVSPSTDHTPKNRLALYKAWTGGDGTDQFLMHGLLLDRLITKRFFARVKLGVGQSGRRVTYAIGENALEQFLTSENLSADNESSDPRIEHETYRSASVNIGFTVNAAGVSRLSLIGGFRYMDHNVLNTRSRGGMTLNYQEAHNRYHDLFPEIGLQYDYDISSRIYAGASANAVLERLQFDAGIVVGVKF